MKIKKLLPLASLAAVAATAIPAVACAPAPEPGPTPEEQGTIDVVQSKITGSYGEFITDGGVAYAIYSFTLSKELQTGEKLTVAGLKVAGTDATLQLLKDAKATPSVNGKNVTISIPLIKKTETNIVDFEDGDKCTISFKVSSDKETIAEKEFTNLEFTLKKTAATIMVETMAAQNVELTATIPTSDKKLLEVTGFKLTENDLATPAEFNGEIYFVDKLVGKSTDNKTLTVESNTKVVAYAKETANPEPVKKSYLKFNAKASEDIDASIDFVIKPEAPETELPITLMFVPTDTKCSPYFVTMLLNSEATQAFEPKTATVIYKNK